MPRIQSGAEPNEIVVSHTVVDLAVGSAIRSEPRGAATLKGFDVPWEFFAVSSSGSTSARARRSTPPMAMEGVAAAQARIAEIKATAAQLFGSRGATVHADFSSMFAAATAAAPFGAGPGSTLTKSAPGTLTTPPELEAYGNGRVPLGELVPIGDGSERLWAPAAAAFRRMATDAWRAGVDLKVNDGYRDLDDQHRLAGELGLYRDGGRAAVPGTSSHGWGLSVDIDTDGGAGEWLEANAARYGFHDDVPGEPWHWTYRP